MPEPAISVVIPTRDRCAILGKTLKALARQEGVAGRFEVIVVDDGSTDSTQNLLRLVDLGGHALKSVPLDHGGPARARNRGIAVAAGERILLLGDDTIPEPGCLAVHAAADSDTGIQGMIDWDPDVGITDVMQFLAPEGPQFWFKGLGEGSHVPWTSVVSANLSAPRSWFVDEPFDECFTEACMEDTELAWRWHRRQWDVRFSTSALCLHHHRYDEIEPFLAKQRRAGRWARTVLRQHPELFAALVLRPVAVGCLRLGRAGVLAVFGRLNRTDVWDLRCRASSARGLMSAGRSLSEALSG